MSGLQAMILGDWVLQKFWYFLDLNSGLKNPQITKNGDNTVGKQKKLMERSVEMFNFQ